MPTYEFRCPDGTIVERIFKMSEVPETIPSPNGDGDAVRIISGGAGLLFKGTGFYITDYGKDGKKDQRQASNESAAKEPAGDKSDSSKSDSSKGDSSKGETTKATAPAPSSSGSEGGSSSATATGSAKPASGVQAGTASASKKSDDS